MIRLLAAALAAILLPLPALAAQPPPAGASSTSAAEAKAAEAAEAKARADFLAGLTKATGSVTVPEAGAVMNLGDAYYFLDKADSKQVLVDAWGNPKGSADAVLGMIFAKGTTPLDPRVWGAVLTYETTGYVSDDDARKTDYDKVLARLRKDEDQDNEARKKEGVPTVHLAGWAQVPTYDSAHHSLVWARDLQFGGIEEHTLNYDVRVLARRGVLSMNIVGDMSDLARIRAAAASLQQVPRFRAGEAYADYKPGVDKRASYGVAGLVLAGAGVAVAQKAGLIAVALLFLKKGFVVIAALAAGGWAWIKRMLGRRAQT